MDPGSLLRRLEEALFGRCGAPAELKREGQPRPFELFADLDDKGELEQPLRGPDMEDLVLPQPRAPYGRDPKALRRAASAGALLDAASRRRSSWRGFPSCLGPPSAPHSPPGSRQQQQQQQEQLLAGRPGRRPSRSPPAAPPRRRSPSSSSSRPRRGPLSRLGRLVRCEPSRERATAAAAAAVAAAPRPAPVAKVEAAGHYGPADPSPRITAAPAAAAAARSDSAVPSASPRPKRARSASTSPQRSRESLPPPAMPLSALKGTRRSVKAETVTLPAPRMLFLAAIRPGDCKYKRHLHLISRKRSRSVTFGYVEEFELEDIEVLDWGRAPSDMYRI